MGTTPKIAYPTGLSPQLAANLSSAANGADAFSGKLDTGTGTLTTVTSDVSVALNEIRTHMEGKSITAMSGFWDGAGAIGSGGLGTGGVISDASKAMNFMTSLSGCMPGVSGNINDQVSTIQSGLSAISTVQANPNKEWKPEEANSLQSQINNMVSALSAVNTALLNTASAIESAASSVKLGSKIACESGVVIGQTTPPHGPLIIPTTSTPPKKLYIANKDGKVTGEHPVGEGGGGGNKPPGGGKPPAPPAQPPGGEPWWKKFINFRKVNGKWRVFAGDGYRIPGVSNTVVNFFNSLISGGINYIVPTMINSVITTQEGILLGLGGGFVAMVVGSAFEVPELFLVATGASAIVGIGGSMILKYAGLGKKGAPATTVTITPVTSGQYKGDYKIDYKGKTYYEPPSQLQTWLRQHGLGSSSTPTPVPTH